MRLNFARQPLIPAFLSLVLLLVVALCHTASGTIAPILRVGVDQAVLPIPAAGAALEAFRLAHPNWAHTIGGFLILFSAMTIGRMTARFKLYGINTFVAMPLYALCMMGVVRSEWWFSGLVASTLLTLAVKNFCYSFRNGFSFDATFRGGMYLALLLLVEPKSAPLLLALPIALMQFRRATRESLVALGGLLLPPLTLGYLNWALGGSFIAPFVELYHRFMQGEWLTGMLHAPLTEQIFCGVLLLLNLLSIALFLANSYTLSTRSRHTLLYASYLLLLTVATFLLPAGSIARVALLAVPSALLLPVLLIRIRRSITQILYPLLVVAVLASLYF